MTFLLIPLMVLLVLCSAFFSSSEISSASANKLHIRSAAEKGSKRASRVLRIQEQFTRFLSTILVGNNLVNILASSICTWLFAQFFGTTSQPRPVWWSLAPGLETQPSSLPWFFFRRLLYIVFCVE